MSHSGRIERLAIHPPVHLHYSQICVRLITLEQLETSLEHIAPVKHATHVQTEGRKARLLVLQRLQVLGSTAVRRIVGVPRERNNLHALHRVEVARGRREAAHAIVRIVEPLEHEQVAHVRQQLAHGEHLGAIRLLDAETVLSARRLVDGIELRGELEMLVEIKRCIQGGMLRAQRATKHGWEVA